MCNIKYFICDPVSVTKKLRPLQAKIKYQCELKKIKYLFLLEKVAITGVTNKIFNLAHLYYMI